ncbi:MAG: hypothetical protein S4CHLAM2_05390 [Chlamydiales bacterium]|nr:hypothetical protein [Chlamydiales bacterium]
MVWAAIDVFLLAFATILLGILFTTIGNWTQRLTRLPYLLSLMVALVSITGIFVLIFWLYSPLIAGQFQLLINELPKAALNLRDTFAPYLSDKLISGESLRKEFSFNSQAILSQAYTLFSSTVGSIVSFVIFLIVGFYLAVLPQRYLRGALYIIPDKNHQRVEEVLTKIGQAIRFWLLGKVLSMIAIGTLTFAGLWFLNIPLAFILGLLAGLLTFIPYVGPILASIPALLIAFAESPFSALYVLILYIGVHVAEGYLITPFIEQKTVSIPPALTIMGQILLFVLIGGLGLALASPIIVVIMSLIVSLKGSTKVVNQA